MTDLKPPLNSEETPEEPDSFDVFTKEAMRVAVVGSRDFPDLATVKDFVNLLPNGSVIVSGGARGVDTAAYEAALERGLGTKIYYADWEKHGKSAGFIRNQDIVKDADLVVLFWDEQSKGTEHTLALVKKWDKAYMLFVPGEKEEPNEVA